MTQDELKAKHPRLYIYCECGDGWLRMIDDFFGQVEQRCRGKKNWPIFGQIKQKFGGLRVYVDAIGDMDPQELSELIHVLEVKSWNTCERCGGGNSRLRQRTRWLQTLCDKCEGEEG